MKHYRTVLIIGVIEVLIGGITLLVNFASFINGTNTKTLNVLFFVIAAASISTLIGLGILKFKKAAYQLLLYFSSVIVLSKILIFMGIIHLNGALETTVPSFLKSMISIVYHSFVIYYLQKKDIKQIFHL